MLSCFLLLRKPYSGEKWANPYERVGGLCTYIFAEYLKQSPRENRLQVEKMGNRRKRTKRIKIDSEEDHRRKWNGKERESGQMKNKWKENQDKRSERKKKENERKEVLNIKRRKRGR